MSKEEILDLVDHNDQPYKTENRSQVYKLGLRNFRVINAFIIGSDQKIWIPKRSAKKALFPSCLDASIGGHVISGETYFEAFVREAKEEMNLNIHELSYRILGRYSPHNHPISAFMTVYLVEFDGCPNYNKSDFDEASWMSLKEIRHLLDQKVPSKGDFQFLIQQLSYNLNL